MVKPLVDIVVPVYNGELFLRECLESLMSQDYQNWRATIVNNKSNDRTYLIAYEFTQRDARFNVLDCEIFLSQTENYNRALSQISLDAKYSLLLEADNWISPQFLEETTKVAESDERIGMVSVYYFNKKKVVGEGIDCKQSALTGTEAGRLLLLGNLWLGPPTVILFRTRAILAQTPAFRDGIPYDDTDLYLRILRNWDFGFVHAVLAYVRDDPNSTYGGLARLDLTPATSYFLSTRYAEKFLSAREASKLCRDVTRRYYQAIGRSVASCRITRAYIKFHSALFMAEGITFDWIKFLQGVVHVMLDVLLNPKRSFESAWVSFKQNVDS